MSKPQPHYIGEMLSIDPVPASRKNQNFLQTYCVFFFYKTVSFSFILFNWCLTIKET